MWDKFWLFVEVFTKTAALIPQILNSFDEEELSLLNFCELFLYATIFVKVFTISPEPISNIQ